MPALAEKISMYEAKVKRDLLWDGCKPPLTGMSRNMSENFHQRKYYPQLNVPIYIVENLDNPGIWLHSCLHSGKNISLFVTKKSWNDYSIPSLDSIRKGILNVNSSCRVKNCLYVSLTFLIQRDAPEGECKLKTSC